MPNYNRYGRSDLGQAFRTGAVPSSWMDRVRVAFQGARGAFSEQASRQLLPGQELRLKPCEKFFEVFESLREATADLAVVPIENTLHGSVHENYDHLLHYHPAILAETYVRIVHNLIGHPKASRGCIERAISHPVALAQCVDFFRRNPDIRAESHYDTGGSVKTVMERADIQLAAVASQAAADYYGAQVLEASIEDDPENYTRFFLLGPRDSRGAPADGPCKTSLVFVTKNVSGALFRCLSAFALRDISLTKIESRPLKGRPFEYRFYVDICAAPEDENCANALRHLSELTEFMAILGSYEPAKFPTVPA